MSADHWQGDCGDVVTALESDGLPYFVPQRYFLGIQTDVDVDAVLKASSNRLWVIPFDPAEYTATARGTA